MTRAAPNCARQPARSACDLAAGILVVRNLVSCISMTSAAERCTTCLTPVAQQLVLAVSKSHRPALLGGRQLISVAWSSASAALQSSGVRIALQRRDLPLTRVPSERLRLLPCSVDRAGAGATSSSARRLSRHITVAAAGLVSL